MPPSSTLPAILLAILLLSCNKEEQLPAPVIQATVSPAKGNTTQTFHFDLSKSESRTGRGDKLFTRWDWDGDGSWDTPFTRMLEYQHRFYAPGTWKPRLEMSNLEGATDTLSLEITVAQGYSTPRGVLVVTPEYGHPFTRFLLDASSTHDDEDSLNQIKFRWDFEGDGQWDTPFGDSVSIHHTYPQTGVFQPVFQARDPSGLVGTASAFVKVSFDDPRLVATFRCVPDSVTDNTEILMDASESRDLDNPGQKLFYRWDWENDRIWDTGWLSDPVTVHIFKEEYIHFVRLQVMSQRGLQNEIALKIRVWHKNRPPVASFSVSSLAGNTLTDFRIDGWSTRDFESSPSGMFIRWDFDGDGQWDTEPSHEPAIMHRFSNPGTYSTRMEVTDPHGAGDTFSKVITIGRGTNETGIYLDNRGLGYEYYGIVRIGDQWWFSRSLSVQDANRGFGRKYEERYYDGDESVIYRDYGNLYMHQKLPALCPAGWRIPTKADWEKLFANYPEDQLYEALMPGGISDFGATLGGKGKGIWDSIPECQGKDQMGYYWSSSAPLDPSASSSWIVAFDYRQKKVLRGFDVKEDMLYGVRCVKSP